MLKRKYLERKELIKMMNVILRKQLAVKKNKKKGFTLIELIVVIVIIAIIAAIAVPSLTRYIASAEKRQLQAAAHNVQLVLQAEKSEQFQNTFADFDTNDELSGTLSSTRGLSLYSGTPTVDSDIKTYDEIFIANGIDFKDLTLTDVSWDKNTLKEFTLENSKYSIGYNIAGGFQSIDTKP